MKAKNAVLYFTDSETGKKMQVKLPEAVIGIYREEEVIFKNNSILSVDTPFTMSFAEYELSEVPSVKYVVHSNNVCTVIWSDGKKTQSVCHTEDTYNKDVGLLVAWLKRFMPTEEVIELVETWSHKQKKQEDVNARKKAEKARKQYKSELEDYRKQVEEYFKEKTFVPENVAALDIDPFDILWGISDEVANECKELWKKVEEADWKTTTICGIPVKYKKL